MSDVIEGAAAKRPIKSVYDRVELKFRMWRYGMPKEMAEWCMRRDAKLRIRSEATEMAEFIVDECYGR